MRFPLFFDEFMSVLENHDFSKKNLNAKKHTSRGAKVGTFCRESFLAQSNIFSNNIAVINLFSEMTHIMFSFEISHSLFSGPLNDIG